MSWTDAQRKYAQSIKGIEARKRFQQSDKGKALKTKYLAKRNARLQELKKKTNTAKSENKLPKKAPKTIEKFTNK